MFSNEKGWKRYPVPLKNFVWNSTQCSLMVCRKHSMTSMNISTPTVAETQIGSIMNSKTGFEDSSPVTKVYSQKTFDSCE